MKFDLYYADIDLYEITINDMVCDTSNASIKDLIKELQDLYIGNDRLLWSKLNTVNYYYETEYINPIVITHICQIEYTTVDEFFSNFLTYLATTYPELLL